MPTRTRFARGLCLLFALTTFIAAQSAVLGAGLEAKKLRTGDVALQNNGELRGQILDQQGRPQALSKVAVWQDQKVVAIGKTDLGGRFAIRGLKPGAYHVQSEFGIKSVRLWAPQTAPPAAQQAVLVVADRNVVRASIDHEKYGPAIHGAIAGGLITGLTYWGFDYNPSGS